MGDGETKAFWQEGKPADGGRRFEAAQFLRLHEGGLAGGPRHRAVGPDRDMIDPAMLWVRRNGAACAADIGFHDFAVVAARDDDELAHGRRQDRAAMDRDALGLAARRRQHHGFLAEHEHGHAAEKMRGDDRTARRDRMDAFDDGGGVVAGVGHGAVPVLHFPSPAGGGSLAGGEPGGECK